MFLTQVSDYGDDEYYDEVGDEKDKDDDGDENDDY